MAGRSTLMQLLRSRAQEAPKTKPPDPWLGIGRRRKNVDFRRWLLSKREAWAFPPKPSVPTVRGTSPLSPWDVSPVGNRGRSYSDSLRRLPEVRNWGKFKPRLKGVLWIVIEFLPRHADLRSGGRSNRFPSRTIAGAARTYGLVRRPRPGARPALPGQEKHNRHHGSECPKSTRNRESREGLPVDRQCVGIAF